MNPYRADPRPLRKLDPRRLSPTERMVISWLILGACFGTAIADWLLP